jgi:hypothetical protein
LKKYIVLNAVDLTAKKQQIPESSQRDPEAVAQYPLLSLSALAIIFAHL